MVRCILALCFGIWRCLLGILALLGFDSSNSALLLLSDDSDNALQGLSSDGLLSLLGIFALLGLCPNFPIFLKLPKLSPSRMGRQGQSRTPGQGQDTGRYPAVCNVTAILEVTGELSHRASIVSIISIVPIHLLD